METRRTSSRPEVVPGERVYLSQVLQEDVPLIARWKSDLEMTAYMSGLGDSFTLEQVQAWHERTSHDPLARSFAIVVREGERLIGDCWLTNIEHQHGIAELGIAIGDKGAWGRGYGTETVRLLVDYGFTFLGLSTIYLWHHSFNIRGHRAYLKAGFKEAGRLRAATVFDRQRFDRVLMDVTRTEFGPSELRRIVRQIDAFRA